MSSVVGDAPRNGILKVVGVGWVCGRGSGIGFTWNGKSEKRKEAGEKTGNGKEEWERKGAG